MDNLVMLEEIKTQAAEMGCSLEDAAVIYQATALKTMAVAVSNLSCAVNELLGMELAALQERTDLAKTAFRIAAALCPEIIAKIQQLVPAVDTPPRPRWQSAAVEENLAGVEKKY